MNTWVLYDAFDFNLTWANMQENDTIQWLRTRAEWKPSSLEEWVTFFERTDEQLGWTREHQGLHLLAEDGTTIPLAMLFP